MTTTWTQESLLGHPHLVIRTDLYIDGTTGQWSLGTTLRNPITDDLISLEVVHGRCATPDSAPWEAVLLAGVRAAAGLVSPF